MSQAARIRPENLNDNASELICSTLKREILAFVKNPVFSRYEQVKTKLTLVRCQEAGQLQRYYAALVKEREKREKARGWAPTQLLPAGDTWDTGTDSWDADDEAEWNRHLDECDKDAA